MTIRWVARAVPRLTTVCHKRMVSADVIDSASHSWMIHESPGFRRASDTVYRTFARVARPPSPRQSYAVHLGLPQRRSHLPPAIMFPAASRLKRDRCEDDLWNSLLVNPQPCKIHREDKSWPTAAHFRPRQNRKDVYLTCCFSICSIFCSKIRMRTADFCRNTNVFLNFF